MGYFSFFGCKVFKIRHEKIGGEGGPPPPPFFFFTWYQCEFSEYFFFIRIERGIHAILLLKKETDRMTEDIG